MIQAGCRCLELEPAILVNNFSELNFAQWETWGEKTTTHHQLSTWLDPFPTRWRLLTLTGHG
jgi:hypothetical protein